jgi:hypothetical protein
MGELMGTLLGKLVNFKEIQRCRAKISKNKKTVKNLNLAMH